MSTPDFTTHGYVIRETGPVYYTLDMDRTAAWFADVIGWHYEIDERNEQGQGLYGCVYALPKEIETQHITPFTGIHLFRGAPTGGMAAFIKIEGLRVLHGYVVAHGWHEVTAVRTEPWGAEVCSITTPDGYEMRFFEVL